MPFRMRQWNNISILTENFFINVVKCNDLHEMCINVSTCIDWTCNARAFNKLYKINGCIGCLAACRLRIWHSVDCQQKALIFISLWSKLHFINIQISILLHFILSFIDFSTLFRLTWLEYWTKKCCARSVNHGGAVQF